MDRWMNRGIDVWRCEGRKGWMDGWLSKWEGVVSVCGGGVVRAHGYVRGYGYLVFCTHTHAQRSEEDIWLPVV